MMDRPQETMSAATADTNTAAISGAHQALEDVLTIRSAPGGEPGEHMALHSPGEDKEVGASPRSTTAADRNDTPTEPADADLNEGESRPVSGTNGASLDKELTTEKPKKKKKKKSGKNKKPPITGFEEGYCELPMTPAEHMEEKLNLYDPSRSFVERVQHCIQRYRARRKFDEKRSNIFSKYLSLGGVDSGVKAFGGGLDKEILAESTAAEIAEMTATDYIRAGTGRIKFYDGSDSEHWVVDFEGIVKGFLSCRAPRIFGLDDETIIKEYCRVIHNFIQYVLAHEVCPEYEVNLRAARSICVLAETELWMINQLAAVMPGDFNKAASTLYGGFYKGLNVEEPTWTTDLPQTLGMSNAVAERIFNVAIGHLATTEQFEAMMDCKQIAYVTKTDFRSLEVVEIVMPSQEVKYYYSGTKDTRGVAGNLKPLGVLRVKNWNNPEAAEEDLTEEEEAAIAAAGGSINDSVTEDFWLEEHILKLCFVGMKFECTVRELNIGVKYFDSIMGIYCSFFTYLPNERVSDWKEPRPNERPPPMAGGDENQDFGGGEDYD